MSFPKVSKSMQEYILDKSILMDSFQKKTFLLYSILLDTLVRKF